MRRVQVDKKIVETKTVNRKALTTAGVLAGRVERGLVSAISNSAIKGRYWTGLAVPSDIGNS